MCCGLHLYNKGHCAKSCVNPCKFHHHCSPGQLCCGPGKAESVLRLALESYVSMAIVAQMESLVALMENVLRLALESFVSMTHHHHHHNLYLNTEENHQYIKANTMYKFKN